MLKRIAIALGYAKAPKAMFLARHPRTGLTALLFGKGLRRSKSVRRVSGGLVGLGALAALLPAMGALLLRR